MMSAETHSYRDPLEIATDLELLDLFDVAGEEFGERSLADVDLEDLQALRTMGELAGAIVDWAQTADRLGQP